MRHASSVIAILSALFLLGSLNAQEAPLKGYSTDSSQAERRWEEQFRKAPMPENIRANMEHLAARPHHVGSAYDKENAEWIAAKIKDAGFDTQIESFSVLFPSPKERKIELLSPTKFTAKLQEPPVSVDPTSSQQNEQLPTFNIYSRDGDVTAPLVYVNWGIPSDYEQLDRMGISVKGAIVIARYGHSWRGIKPKIAAEHGAVACIIYSDPREDGYSAGDTYPKGPFRPKEGVQRGSVMDMTLYSGDPLTPGVGATPDAKRLKIEDSPVITKIPVLPISYGDAQPLLEALGGPVAPEDWRGGLPITYHVGPGPASVHFVVKFNWDMKPLYDVIGKIRGTDYPDEWVIRGNHHDGWVNGAEDPISGTSAMLEEVRVLGELLKAGWKPKRTIVYCAWDGEEEGLLGSTEWVETHEAELEKSGVIYVNSDVNERGLLEAEGSHTLEQVVNDVAKSVDDPETSFSVWKREQLYAIGEAKSAEDRQELRQRADLRIGALGSGSDFTPFLQHAGVASVNFGFGGEANGGIYHSIYDDFYWYTHFGDTDFKYGRALAQTAGTLMMRMADADLVPLDFTDFADQMQVYRRDLEHLAKTKRDETIERNREIAEGVFTATADPKERSVPPPVEAVPPVLNFAPLENAEAQLTQSAENYRKALQDSGEAAGKALPAATLASVNEILVQSERKLITESGLPNRPWYRHQIYAPGAYTGYAVKTMPAIREAIEQKQWAGADAGIVVVAKVLQAEAGLIDEATAKIAGGGR